MRHFILIHSPTPPPGFSLRGYASSSKRLDIAARALKAALYLKRGIRRNTIFHLYFYDTGKYLEFRPRDVPFKWVEREVMQLFRDKLGEAESLDYRVFLDKISGIGGAIVVLDEKGSPMKLYSEALSSPTLVIMLGGRTDIPPELLSMVAERGGIRISIGPGKYLASHCIAFIHYALDSGIFSHL